MTIDDMNVDSAFQIGKSHRVCQDYAESGLHTMYQPPGARAAYAIVSDGCSSSPQTDFGARILTRIYSKHPDWMYRKYEFFEDHAAHLERYTKGLQLDATSMDATLVAGAVFGDTYRVYVAGDGVVARVYADRISVTVVSYPSNAPLYLNYHLDENRKKAYRAKFGTKRNCLSYDILSNGEVNFESVYEEETEDESVWYQEGSTAGLQALCLMSDGVESFYRMVLQGATKVQDFIPLKEVLPKLLGFKGYQGEFVQRRMQRFSKDCHNLEWEHSDDLSLAVIAINKEV
jgi:hypothetical protein